MKRFYLKNKHVTLDLFESNNYSMLYNLGMVSYAHKRYSFSENVIVVRDDDDFKMLGKPKVFPLSDLLKYMYYVDVSKMIEEIDENRKQNLGQLKLFLAFFNKQKDHSLINERDSWFKIKAWRYDIHDPSYTLGQVVELCDKLPLFPNWLKKSSNGWHLIYIFNKFIERSIIEHYKNDDEKFSLQYKVYKILIEELPFYLKEIEPRIDIENSNNVNKIFTRFDDGTMPCYIPVFNKNNIYFSYTLDTFYNAYSFLSGKHSP